MRIPTLSRPDRTRHRHHAAAPPLRGSGQPFTPAKITFAACNNTKQGMEKREGKPISIISEAMIVPSGVVQLMELQEQGWSYIRP